jgi:hypothetical protein
MAARLPKVRPRNALFEELPLELRELIYRYVVTLPSSDIFFMPRLSISAADIIAGSDPNFPAWLSPIARVSSRTRADIALYVLRQVEVYIPYPLTIQRLRRFLSTLPAAQAQNAIRRLNFPSFGAIRFVKESETVYIDFLKSCTQLASLQIGINALDLRRRCKPASSTEESYGTVTTAAESIVDNVDLVVDDADFIMDDAESIMDSYRLRELLNLPRLASLSFELCPLLNVKPVSRVVAEVKKVAVLLTKMFAARDRRVEVLVIDFRGKQWK